MKRHVSIYFLIIAAALAALLLSSCATGPVDPDTVRAELISDDRVSIAVCPQSELLDKYRTSSELYLFVLGQGQSLDEANYAGGLTFAAKKKSAERVDFDLPLTEGGVSRLYSRFVAAFFDTATNRFVEATTLPAYISNPERLGADNSPDLGTQSSIKGIEPYDDTDALALGVSHALIEVKLDDYLLGTGSAEALSYVFRGRTYFVSPTAIEALDKRVKLLSDGGVRVYLRFTLGRSASELPAGLSSLACVDSEPGASGYAINFTSPEGAACATGFFEFMAGRYTDPSREHGFCADFIAGYGANSPSVNADCGAIADAYFDNYFAFVRALHTALSSHCASGRVYVAVDHRLRTSAGGSADMTAEGFIRALAVRSAATGDFSWGIAAGLRSTAVDSDRVWYDNSNGGKTLTPANVSALTDGVLAEEAVLFGGEKRRTLIDGFSVALSGDADVAADELNQAASYAYTYYCALRTEAIGALIYSSHVDSGNADDGIWQTDEAGNVTGERDKLYRMMKYIDTDYPINDLLDGAIESAKWDSLYEACRERAAANRLTVSTVSGFDTKEADSTVLEAVNVHYDAELLYDLTAATDDLGFYVVGGQSFSSLASGFCASVKQSSPEQRVLVRHDALDAATVSRDKLILHFKLSSPARLTLTLEQDDGKGGSLIYESSVDAPVGEHAAVFDLSDYRDAGLGKGEVRMSLSVDPSGESSECEFKLLHVLSAKAYSNTLTVVLLALLGTVALIAVGAIFVSWFRKNYEIRIEGGSKKKKSSRDGDDDDMKLR